MEMKKFLTSGDIKCQNGLIERLVLSSLVALVFGFTLASCGGDHEYNGELFTGGFGLNCSSQYSIRITNPNNDGYMGGPITLCVMPDNVNVNQDLLMITSQVGSGARVRVTGRIDYNYSIFHLGSVRLIQTYY